MPVPNFEADIAGRDGQSAAGSGSHQGFVFFAETVGEESAELTGSGKLHDVVASYRLGRTTGLEFL
ncbi:MAG TPA: hypothetical protein VFU48_11915 [Nitrospira sp.]|nr:hypothetical protein [Nitrospira sp.]